MVRPDRQRGGQPGGAAGHPLGRHRAAPHVERGGGGAQDPRDASLSPRRPPRGGVGRPVAPATGARLHRPGAGRGARLGARGVDGGMVGHAPALRRGIRRRDPDHLFRRRLPVVPAPAGRASGTGGRQLQVGPQPVRRRRRRPRPRRPAGGHPRRRHRGRGEHGHICGIDARGGVDLAPRDAYLPATTGRGAADPGAARAWPSSSAIPSCDSWPAARPPTTFSSRASSWYSSSTWPETCTWAAARSGSS